MQVGGFDTAYGKGYFEDTDLSFKLRKQGHRVVFQPMSLAFHQEGTSLGDDTSKAKQELMARSQKVFLDRWGAEIKVRLWGTSNCFFYTKNLQGKTSAHSQNEVVTDI